MPHVVLTGSPDLPALFGSLQPITEIGDDQVLRTKRAFLARDQSAFVIEAVAVENGRGLPFFVLVQGREDGLVVRLHPDVEVEKTRGVKRLLATVADHLRMLDPELQIGETNLGMFLAEAQTG